MQEWNRRAARLVHRIERRIDRSRAGGEPDTGPARIEAYRGFGTPERVRVSGRVLRGPPIAAAGANDSAWRNLSSMLRRFESDEVAGARVRARIGGCSREFVADEEGFFESWLEPSPPLSAGSLWHTVALELLDPPGDGSSAAAPVLVPPPDSRFGVISDLDDTVIRTGATRLLRMLRTVLLGNARTRLPFPGVAAFYRALQHGAGSASFNPIFYVSSSPWNLYDVLTEFLSLQRIPHGPLFLRDWGINGREFLPTAHGEHKLAAIRELMDFYPHLPFLLLGDSGQEDPEIYHRVVHDYPERILAVYIRNVSPAPERAEAIRALAREVEQAGSVLLLTGDTVAAAVHAAERGWIPSDALPEIRADATGGT